MLAEKSAIGKDFAIQYWERNLIFTGKDVLAVYKIPLTPVMYKSPEDKRSVIMRLDDLFWVYRGRGQLLLLSRQESTDEQVDKLRELQFHDSFPEMFKELEHEQRKRLKNQAPWRQELYLILHLPRKKESEYSFDFNKNDIKHTLSKFWRGITDRGLEVIGRKSDLELEKVKESISVEKSLFAQLNGTLSMERATPREIEWILKRSLYRSIGEPPLHIGEKAPVSLVEKQGSVYLRPKKAAMLQLFDKCWIQEKAQSLVVQHGDKDSGKQSHQSFLSLVNIPEEVNSIGGEWLYWLMVHDFPVDVSIRFNIVDPGEEITRLRRKRKEFRGEAKQLADSGKDIPIDMQETDMAGSHLEYKLSKGQPLMWTETILAVSGSSKREVDEKARAIETFYRPRFFIFQRSVGDALRCFRAFIPGGEQESFWSFPMDPGFFASGGIHFSNDIGDPSGSLLGETTHGSPVRYNMSRPMSRELNKAGTIVILGTLGGGKSVLKKKLILENLLLGGKVFSVDPKGEDHIFLEFPELKPLTKVLRFRAGSDETTRLNVFRLSHNPDKAWEIAQGYLELLLEAKGEARRLVIANAMEKTMVNTFPSMLLFLEKLSEIELTEPDDELKIEARRCIQLLKAAEKDPLGKIVFHDDQSELALSEYPLVIADLRGLMLPKDSKEMGNRALTAVERFSVGIMYLVTAMGQELMLNAPQDIVKLFALDESWAVTKIPQGEQLVKEFVKLGRSLNIVPLLATQEASDVANEEIRNNVGVVFSFRMNSPNEIADAMEMLRMSSSVDEMVPRFRELKSGTCYFRDIEGRTNRLNIWLPQQWLKVFDTSNDTAEEQRKKKQGVA